MSSARREALKQEIDQLSDDLSPLADLPRLRAVQLMNGSALQTVEGLDDAACLPSIGQS